MTRTRSDSDAERLAALLDQPEASLEAATSDDLRPLRQVIAEVRTSRPLPPTDPDWDALSQQIHHACATTPVQRSARGLERRRDPGARRAKRTGWHRLTGWLTRYSDGARRVLRPRIMGPLVATAAIVSLLLWSSHRDSPPASDPLADWLPFPAEPMVGLDELAPCDLDRELAALEEPELDRLLAHLTPQALGFGDDPMLPGDLMLEWADPDPGAETDLVDLDPVPMPDPDYFLEDLSENQLDALTAWLDQAQAG